MTSTQSAQNSTLITAQPEFEDSIDLQEQNSELQATHIHRQCQLDERYIGQRFDQIAAQIWDDFSREKLKTWMTDGVLRVNGQKVKPKARSEGNEIFTLDVELEAQLFNQPENIALDIVYEDDDLLVINKPVGMVVHPGAGNPTGTLVNALLYHYPKSRELARAGLVHRIDKDTSGLLVVAKTLEAQHSLTRQLSSKSVYRLYDLVCYGRIIAGGTIDAPIKRHPVDRTKMAVVNGGRDAVTHYNVIERFQDFTLVQAQLETGRTHQIRVHFSHISHPLVGDQTYARLKLPKGISSELATYLQQFKRQALHACVLGLIHPTTGEEMEFEAAWPEDFAELVNLLQQEERGQ
ncbi:23S rRNA pseudouridine(1911/1915/1917) synthase RluD [Acinetobacter populi]|jgi:23S rRNA pseudouridine1911/1915/1917 synthase|uniref:Pseudouridine synthase n=1 Tax=Acinetobacter populi TaxID=1582270 RepID=A0A1Z9YU69_9GAMM|nr:23S rRNA pseudouridine(1911/1915/1917) synthase RluD [Acinetobacter populi]MCH4246823.1 23S rRNA pseudouridine(1911/1915/1917) synthase RluD [Acinetobacter populi]OUY05741.1 23S rRNA pseudouridine(1911/1915/1917) synthase [Acinetobacter populi]